MDRQRDGVFGKSGDVDGVEDVDGFDDIDVPDAPGDAVTRAAVPDAEDRTPRSVSGGEDAPASDGGDGDSTRVPDDVAGDGEDTDRDDAGTAAEPVVAPRPRRDIYDVVGRARPQKIEPVKPAAAPVPASSGQDATGSPDEGAEPYGPSGVRSGRPSDTESTETTVFPGTTDDTGSADSATRVFAPAGPVDGAYDDSSYDADLYRGSADAGAGAVEGYEGDGGDYATREYGAQGYAPAGAAGVPGGDTEYGVDSTARDDGQSDDVVAPVRRGTLDLGLLLLRAVVGVLLGLRGVQTLFTVGGDPGIDTLEQVLGGYDAAAVLALALPVAELVGGALLLLGLLTPFGGAVAVVSAGFMALHFLASSAAGHWPYQLDVNAQAWGFLALGGLVLILTGPGRYAVDGSRGWATRPRLSAWLFAVIGVAGAAALWILVGGGNPL